MSGDDHQNAPQRDRWLRRRPTWLALGIAGTAYAIGTPLLLSDAYLGAGHWLAAVVMIALGAWGLAQLIDGDQPRAAGATRRPDSRGGGSTRSIVVTVVAWWLILPLLGGLWSALDVPVGLIGTVERVLLAPFVAVVLFRLAIALRLHRIVSAIAVVIAVLSLFRTASVQGDYPIELVAAAGPAQLQAALRDDTTIALASTRQDRGTRVAPIPVKPGMRCQRIEVRDQRRTLVGSPAGRTEITTDTCWRADGTPFAVRVIASSDDGESMAPAQAVQVLGGDAFRLPYGVDRPVKPATPDGAEGSSRGPFGLRPFDDQGRVRLRGDAASPVLARVGRKGRHVELAFGWLRTGPSARSSSAQTASDGQAPAGRFVDLLSSPARHEVLDVFAVTGAFAGGPDARYVRLQSSADAIDLAVMGNDGGMRAVPVGGARERVVLRGGR